MPTPDALKKDILELLTEHRSEGLRRAELRRLLGCRSRADQTLFREVFRDLVSSGLLVRRRGGRYLTSAAERLMRGTITVNSRGFGFVSGEELARDVFIPPHGVGGAISGDTVLIALSAAADSRGPSGMVREIVDRPQRDFIACLDEYRGQLVVRPLRRELPRYLPVAFSRRHPLPDGVSPGDWILARFLGNVGDEQLQVEVVERIASGDSVDGDLDAVIAEFELPEPYSEADEAAAARLDAESVPREDLTDVPTITIDPADAKDFDDALSLSPAADGLLTLGVHIADVAAYVVPGSALDQAAYERGFTSYLPGRTLPMLPRVLAADLCSLLEGEVRPAHSVLLEVDPADGRVVSRRRVRSLVRVTQRLSFREAEELLEGGIPAVELRPGVGDLVAQLGQVAAALRERRLAEEGFLPISLPEVRVLCSEAPARLIGLVRSVPTPAHDLVEECMLAANTAVAEELLERQIPGLFRVHAEPQSEDLETFRTWAAEVLGMSSKPLTTRERLIRLLAGLANSPLKDVVLSAFLRVMPRAAYSHACSGHFGLGKNRYAHFTSPIRRYPDLLVHQQLLHADLGRPLRSQEECAERGTQCSERELAVDSAYYAAVDRLKLRYVEQERSSSPGLYYEGTVCRVLADGLLVYIPELGLQGLVPADALPGHSPRLNRSAATFAQTRSGKNYKCGDVMYVQVHRVDTVRGELSLAPMTVRI